MRLKRKIVFPIFIILTFIIVGLVFSSKEVLAVSGPCYFGTGNCDTGSAPYGDYRTHDVITTTTGRFSGGGGMAIGDSRLVADPIDTKAEFKDFVNDIYAGSGKNKVAGAFIINRMIGKKPVGGIISYPDPNDVNAWNTLMNDNKMVFTRGWDSEVGDTSYYDPVKNDVFFGDHPSVGRDVIILTYDGELVLELETACGNVVPIGNPPTPPDWELRPITTISQTTGYPRDTITWNHKIKNISNTTTMPNRSISAFARFFVNRAGTILYQYDHSNNPAPPRTNPPRCDWRGTLAPKSTTPDCIRSDVIRDDAVAGDLYCQRLYHSPTNSDNSDTYSGQPKCATVLNWGVTSSSNGSVVNDAVIMAGSTVTFRHQINQNGPNPTNKNVDVDIIANTNMPNCEANPPLGPVGSCGAYRWTDLDLATGTGITSKSTERSYTFSNPGYYCETVRVSPSNGNDFNGLFENTSSMCVYVISVDAVSPTAQEYEKGSNVANIIFGANILTGGASCPAGTITFNIYYDISGIASGGPIPITYGGGNCALNQQIPPVSIPSTSGLNDKLPGETVPMTTRIVRPPLIDSISSQNLTVIEVPFVRLFGQDSRVCGDAEANRFMFDERGGQDPNKGSFNQFAAIFKTNDNDPAYNGLHTTIFARDNLRTTWADNNNCVNLPNIDTSNAVSTPIELKETGRRVYNTANTADINVEGDLWGQVTINSSDTVTITGNIVADLNQKTFASTTDDYFKSLAHNTNQKYISSSTANNHNSKSKNIVGAATMPAFVKSYLSNINFAQSKPIPTPIIDPGCGSICGGIPIGPTPIPTPTPIIPPSGSGGALATNSEFLQRPVLIIKAKNIYINDNVTRVDAILIAEEGIYTCKGARNNLHNSCNKSLVINGALRANKIHFLRSTGTRYLANSTITVDSGLPLNINGGGQINTGAGYANSNTNPAEVINMPAFLNFMPLVLPDPTKGSYDTYLAMPPRL